LTAPACLRVRPPLPCLMMAWWTTRSDERSVTAAPWCVFPALGCSGITATAAAVTVCRMLMILGCTIACRVFVSSGLTISVPGVMPWVKWRQLVQQCKAVSVSVVGPVKWCNRNRTEMV
jgi:hypothetical protein